MRTWLVERPPTHLVLLLIHGVVVEGTSCGSDGILEGEGAADVVVRTGGAGVGAAVPGVEEGLTHSWVWGRCASCRGGFEGRMKVVMGRVRGFESMVYWIVLCG